MNNLVALIEKLGFHNRVDGDRVYCKCGHLFTDTEGKWIVNGQVSCHPCYARLRLEKAVMSYGDTL